MKCQTLFLLKIRTKFKMLSAAFLIDALWVHTKCVKQVGRIIGGRFRGCNGGLVEPLV